MTLIAALPSIFHNAPNVNRLLGIIQAELDELRHVAEQLGMQHDIDRATWGLARWEAEMGIEPNPQADVTRRREMIKSHLRSRGVSNIANILNVAESFLGAEVEIIEHPSEYYYTIKFTGIRGVPKNMSGFHDAMTAICPAHLFYTIEYTYAWWGELVEFSWAEMSQKTWAEMRTYDPR